MSSIIKETISLKISGDFQNISVIVLNIDRIINSRKVDYGIFEFTIEALEVTFI